MRSNPSSYPQRHFNSKGCRWCDKSFQPVGPSHLYCSDYCKDNGLSNNYYMNNYKIGLRDVEQMLINQNNLCAICQEVGFKMSYNVKSPLNVDHCHETGTVRGLLCHNCNRALGLFKDNVEWLKRSISYLEGATTISKESTYKCMEAPDSQKG